MLVRAAEESFTRGKKALGQNRKREALAFFEAAVELEARMSAGPPQARYLSYYGLCLALTRRDPQEAVKFCRAATRLEEFNADLHWNLGKVLLVADRRREAHKSYLRALQLHPGHKGARREIVRMGVRRRPVLPFLARGNALNVFLGRLRPQRAPRPAMA